MAASDPSPYVATPTGTLQGVAAFSWDGSVWQPAGRAGPDVATPTGVLQGVAPFSWDGANWQPSGRAQPGVAAPGGALDGVAVYTWSGSAWTPASGTATPSTPSGALRGIAAFSWDGSAWQPAGQARPSVPTPYGVLDGVAFFNWGGSAWQAGAAVPAGATLDLSFMTGTLNPSLTFTRASTATYFDATGTMRTAATNAPRFDYDPVTRALRGLLIEEARTNLMLQSADISNAAWGKGGITTSGPTVTANQTVAPDGTTTAASAAYPAVSIAGSVSNFSQTATATVNPYSFSIWMRGSVGGEQTYLYANDGGATYQGRTLVTLTTAWQRFSMSTPNLTAALWYLCVGVDLRDGGQSSKPAQTIFVWGGQTEQGASSTSYIPTAAATVTRAADVCSTPTAAWFNASASSLAAEYMVTQAPNPSILNSRSVAALTDGPANNLLRLFGQLSNSSSATVSTQIAGSGTMTTTLGNTSANIPMKLAGAWNGTAAAGSLNSGAVVSYAVGMPAGLTTLVIGVDASSSPNYTNGWVRRVRYWPRALSNAELQSVTT